MQKQVVNITRLEIEDLELRQEKLRLHAKSMRETMNKLAEKGYLSKVSKSRFCSNVCSL